MKIVAPKKDLLLPPGIEGADQIVMDPIRESIRVLVDEQVKVTKGGLHLPDGATARPMYWTGVVEAVGPEVEEIKVGWRVAWPANEIPYVCYGEGGRSVIMDRACVAARVRSVGEEE